jgi:hypothetical protein
VHEGGVEVGREGRCPWCKRIFYICRCCDRGQVYCGPEHPDAGQRGCRRRSNALHQASPEGRDDHRDRNRDPAATRGGASCRRDARAGSCGLFAEHDGTPCREVGLRGDARYGRERAHRHDDDDAALGRRSLELDAKDPTHVRCFFEVTVADAREWERRGVLRTSYEEEFDSRTSGTG